MTETTGDAIIFEGLSKRYRRTRRRRRLQLPFSRLDDERGGDDDDVEEDDDTVEDRGRPMADEDRWALYDVSFSVPRGSITAIVGGTAAGKSTLVHILGGVTRPTEGRVLIAGRISPTAEMASALIQGDVTARKNVLLLARFLGVPRRVALARMDEIMEFAGLQGYQRMPLRQYSSRMRPRLAFSSVVHLDPDILLADDKLGVGDPEFRRSCIERVQQLNAERGLTVLLTTGAPKFATVIATHAVWLEQGRVRAEGSPTRIAKKFQAQAAADAEVTSFNARR